MLVVDDDPSVLDFFAEIAEQFGFLCDAATEGTEALQKITEDGQHNLFFIDWKLPGMSGIDLSYQIKKMGAENAVIVMISALEWNTVEKDAKEAGIADFLPKPLFPSSIIACIQKYFGAKSSARDVGSAMIEETFAGRHLLLVEDVEINREIVMTMLEPLKLAVDCAVNGIEAVQMFAANPKQYDLIFMDVQMPEMDGLEATRRIRSSGAPNAKKIPIIAMTANVFREDIDKCLEAGMNEHVGKPLDFSEVIEKLRHHFK